MSSFIIFLIGVTTFIIMVIVYIWHASKRQCRYTTIPGIKVKDYEKGNLPDIAASGSLPQFLLELHTKYGKIVSYWLGHQFYVSIASPELFKEQAHVFDRPECLLQGFKPIFTSHSIAYRNDVECKKRLATYSKCFNHEAIRGYFNVLLDNSIKIKEKWLGVAKYEHIALTENMFEYVFKTTLAISFGKVFESEKEALLFHKAYNMSWSEMEKRIIDGVLPDAIREEKFQKNLNTIHSMILNAAAWAKNNPAEEGEPLKLVDIIQELSLSQEEIKADMVTVMIAAIHTGTYLLTWAIYFIAGNSEVQEKIYEELIDVLGTETIVFEAVSHLRYLNQVIEETLRCSVMAPYAGRVQNIDIELDGHKVPAGTPIIHALGVVLQDETLWPEPEKFDPERFSEENRKKIPSFAFEPFGFAGKRKCMGYRFAYFDTTVLLANILRTFKVELVEGQTVQKVHGLVTKPSEEIWITLTKRE